MKIIKGYDNICRQFDFFESYVTKIEWSSDLFDLMICVNYFWQDKNECQNKDVKIILKNCSYASFDSPQNIGICIEEENSMAKSYVLYSISSFKVKKDENALSVDIDTTERDCHWLNAKCSDLWVEY